MADDYSSVPFTIVEEIHQQPSDADNQYKWISSREEGKLKIQMSNIKLRQAPQETLNMKIVINRPKSDQLNYNGAWMSLENNYNRYQSPKYYNYRIELQFSNYLHEFNQDYSYEIMCKIAIKNQQGSENSFSCTEHRLEGFILSEEKFLLLKHCLFDPYKVPNFRFYIRRLNKNHSNDMVNDEKIYKVISTLRNEGCDVVLAAKNDHHVKAHRSILSQNSHVFDTMFSIDMKEAQDGIVNMCDFEVEVVQKMIDYMYTGQLGELGDMAESLFRLAHSYQIGNLCRRCLEYYIFNVKVDNDRIIELLKIADNYDLEEFKIGVMNFISRHEEELVMFVYYRNYLVQSLNLDNAVTRLISADKYLMADVKVKIFDFVKDNYQQMIKNPYFLQLFISNGRLMQEIHVYLHK